MPLPGCLQPSGKSMDIQVCHVWTVADGKLKRFQQYIDTARLQAIMSA
jgi:ketosteroid isomerase-like protein